MKSKPVILFLESEGFSPDALSNLSSSFDVVFCTLENLPAISSTENIEGLFVRLKFYIDDSVLNYLPNLKFVISPTTGHSHLDTVALERRKIKLVSLKGETAFLSSITATAELTWGLILSLTRLIPSAVSHVAAGGWDRDKFRGIDLAGRTLGIVGYGRLGQIVESYANAFRMNVLIYDIAPRVPVFGQSVSLTQLLGNSDIVTVHVDVNPNSVNMFSDDAFCCMKRSSLFINTSRGELIDEHALIRALNSGQISAAATDVVRDEQTGLSASPLMRSLAELQGRLLITPHIGGASLDSMSKTENFIVTRVLEMGLGVAKV